MIFMRMRVRRSTESSRHGLYRDPNFEPLPEIYVPIGRSYAARERPTRWPEQRTAARSLEESHGVCQNIQTRQSSSGTVNVALSFSLSDPISATRFSDHGKITAVWKWDSKAVNAAREE